MKEFTDVVLSQILQMMEHKTVLISLIILIMYICLGIFFPLLFNGCSRKQNCQNVCEFNPIFIL